MRGNPQTTKELPEGVRILINKDTSTESNLCLMKMNVFGHANTCRVVCKSLNHPCFFVYSLSTKQDSMLICLSQQLSLLICSAVCNTTYILWVIYVNVPH